MMFRLELAYPRTYEYEKKENVLKRKALKIPDYKPVVRGPEKRKDDEPV